MGGKVFQRNFKAVMPRVVKGEGIYLYDEEGKRYLDGCSGALISNLGHGVPEIIDAITEQLKTIEFATLSIDVPLILLPESRSCWAHQGMKIF